MKATFKILTLLILLGLSSVSWARNPQLNCIIKTYDLHFLTAVDGGGRTTNVLHTNRNVVGWWETFTLIGVDNRSSIYGIKTYSGHYLSAQDGGGRITDVIHSNRTQLLDWEKFKIISLGSGWYAIQTFNGNYLTAVDSGGRTTDVIHSNATRIGTWEMFIIGCGSRKP